MDKIHEQKDNLFLEIEMAINSFISISNDHIQTNQISLAIWSNKIMDSLRDSKLISRRDLYILQKDIDYYVCEDDDTVFKYTSEKVKSIKERWEIRKERIQDKFMAFIIDKFSW